MIPQVSSLDILKVDPKTPCTVQKVCASTEVVPKRSSIAPEGEISPRSTSRRSSLGQGLFNMPTWKGNDIFPASNRLSVQITEAERRDQIEALRTRNVKYMLHPTSMVRYSWDLTMAAVTMILMWRVPYAMTFGEGDKLTGYLVDTDVVMVPSLVAKHYVKGWFFIDLIGSIPVEIILRTNSSGIERKAIKASVKYLKIPKLFRVARIIQFVRKYLKFAYTVQIVAIYISLIHWITCLWAHVVMNYDDEVASDDEFLVYSESLYAAVLLMLNVSSVHVPREYMILTSCITIVGFGFYSSTIASVASVIMNTSSRVVLYQEKIRTVMNDLEALRVPSHLRKATKNYYEMMWRVKNTSAKNERVIYEDEDLSPALKSEIALHINRNLVATVPLFEGCSDACLATVVMKLKTQLYMRNDVIFHQGDPAITMNIIRQGKVKVLVPNGDGEILAVLKQGCFFGEMGLISNEKRSATVICATFCELKSLDRKDADEIFELYPHIYQRLFEEAERRRINTRLKAELYNVKVLNNAHAVNVSSIDDVTTESGTSMLQHTSSRHFMDGYTDSNMIKHNGEDTRFNNSDPPISSAELNNMRKTLERLETLLEDVKLCHMNLTRMNVRKVSLFDAIPTKNTQNVDK